MYLYRAGIGGFFVDTLHQLMADTALISITGCWGRIPEIHLEAEEKVTDDQNKVFCPHTVRMLRGTLDLLEKNPTSVKNVNFHQHEETAGMICENTKTKCQFQCDLLTYSNSNDYTWIIKGNELINHTEQTNKK